MKGLFGRLSEALLRAETIAKPEVAATIPPTPAKYVESALVHHSAGRLPDAAVLYQKALAADAEHFDALHLLGVVHQQTGDCAKAVELIGRAVSLAPGNSSAHSNLGIAYRSLNRLEEADASFARALQLNPSSAEALNNLGNIRKERDQLADAEELYRKALAIDHAAPAIWKNLGLVLQRSHRLDEAMDCYRRALEIQSDDAVAHVEIGAICAARGELSQAERNFRLALQIDGNLVDAMCKLGDVLMRLDRSDEAEHFCRSALAVRTDDPDALHSLASVLLRKSKLDEAEAVCRSALSIRRDHALTQMTMGYVLYARDRPGEGDECFRVAMRLPSGGAAARYNLSILKLLRGDYKAGFELYESRFDVFQGNAGHAPAMRELLENGRRWHGEPLHGQRLLVWAEQGFGDSLMMLRYLPMLKVSGAGEVVVLCENELKRVVLSISGLQHSLSCTQMVTALEFDLHCPIMSLPFMFNTTLDSIPNRIPYIDVPESLSTPWQERLASVARPRVGLAWAGSRTLQDDARRSIPLSSFEPILTSEAAHFVSLQKGEGAEEIGPWRGRIEDWMDTCDDFLDTAALVDSLDLVITVDSAVAHLAGALGKPVWLLNRYGSEWRWGLDSEHSLWYPSMRIFRQRASKGWDGVIAQIGSELTKLTELHQG